MGKRNKKAKQIKKSFEEDIQELKAQIAELGKETESLNDDILELHEENSNLRQLIDLQADCFKEQNKSLRWDIEIHNERFRFQRNRITDLKKTVEDEKEKLRKVTDEVLDIGTEIDKASETFLGKIIFKWFRKEN